MASSEQGHTVSHAHLLLATQRKTSEEKTSCNTVVCSVVSCSEWAHWTRNVSVSWCSSRWRTARSNVASQNHCGSPFLTLVTVAQWQSKIRIYWRFLCNWFMQNFHKTAFSRFHVALCWQSDFVMCDKLTSSVVDTCGGRNLKPSLGQLGCSYLKMRLF